jgi:hypothetical protein
MKMARLRASGGEVIERVVIRENFGLQTIVVCGCDEYEAATREGREPRAVGFPMSDVI